ncbi:hypothetical protein D3C76_811500 [compost metagenome]
MLEFFEGQHALGNGGGVEPVNALAAIQLIEGLQVIPALQGQDRTFTLDPAFGLECFVIEVRCAALAPGFILREGLRRFGIGCGGRALIALTHRQFCPQPPGQPTIAGMFEESLGAGVIALLIIHRRQAVGVFETATGTVLQQLDHFLFVGRLITERPPQPTDQRCCHQLLHWLALEQLGHLIIRQRHQVRHQQLQRGVAHRGAVQILRGVQLDGAVPVASGAHHPGFFTEAGDTQFQWITEAVDAQLPGLLEGVAGLFEQIRSRIGFGAHGEQRSTQRVSRPGTA